jgi:hypothetical protein
MGETASGERWWVAWSPRYGGQRCTAFLRLATSGDPRNARRGLAVLESPGNCPANIEPDLGHAVGVVCDDQTLPFFLLVPQKALERLDLQGVAEQPPRRKLSTMVHA